MFWLTATLLAMVAAGFILLPLLYRGRPGNSDRDEINVRLFRERMASLSGDESLGDDEREQLELEARRTLLSDTGSDDEAALSVTSVSKGLWMTALIVPLLALVLYADFGAGLGAITDHELTEALRRADPSDRQAYRQLIDQLADRAQERPDNIDLQFLIARTWTTLGEYERSAETYRDLIPRFPDDISLASYYAEVLFLADDRRMTERVQSAVNAARRLNPHDLTMLEISAIGAINAGDREAALDWFRQALATGVTGERAELIRRAMQQLGVTGEAPGRVIQVNLSIAEGITLPERAVVFVFARAVSGPPAPLAVQRISPQNLPLELRLDESMAMMPGMSIADFDQVQVVARVSETGEVVAKPGDFEVRSEALTLGDEPVKITLQIRDRLPRAD
jgi:cytochrome c-type biogenesis protein CcmH